MLHTREKAMEYILEDEGGYVRRDDGGQANFGITYQTFTDWRAKQKRQAPMYSDLRKLTKEEAAEIYNVMWLDRLQYNDIRAGVDYAFADAAVNLGVTGGIRMVEALFGVAPAQVKWAKMTPELMAALNTSQVDPEAMITVIRDAWIDLKRKAPLYHLRGPGWENRDKRVRQRAIEFIAAEPQPSPAEPAP